jgi:CubicO group peptidase (beta-lactamase class C family)
MLSGLRSVALAVMLASTGCGAAASHPIAFSNAPARFPPEVEGHIHHIEQKLGLAQRMAQYRVPGVSIAVVNRGVVEWARGYGTTEAGRGTRVTQETLFQAASVSKPVAAVAAMRLVQDGRLGLDDDVNRYLRSWHLPPGRDGRGVTLRQLLSHSAGVGIHGFGGYQRGATVPSVVQILEGRRPANNKPIRIASQPGHYAYSGGGYTVVQQLVADASGAPFGEAVYESVLRSLGMTHSTYDQPLPGEFEPYAAAGHDADGNEIPGGWHTYPELAAAGLWTTPTDLARVIVEIQNAVSGRGRLLSAPIAQQMISKQAGNYGLGFNLSGSGRGVRFDHGGVNAGYRVQLMGFAYLGQGAVVMTNGDNGSQLASEITTAIAVEYGWGRTGGRDDFGYTGERAPDEADEELAEATAMLLPPP